MDLISKNEQLKKMVDILPTLRKNAGFTQAALAELLGINRSTLTNIENGRQQLTWAGYLSLIYIFGKVESTNKLLKLLELIPHEFDIDIFESKSAAYSYKEALKEANIISALTYKSVAVFYCDASNGSYDILLYKNFPDDEIKEYIFRHPNYEEALCHLAELYVHPDDRETVINDIKIISSYLSKDKTFQREFKCKYDDGVYLYTEMTITKVGDEQDSLTQFLVEFTKNDDKYRDLINKQNQLEALVSDRTAEIRAKNKSLIQINEDIIDILGNITEARDLESGEHIRRVKGFSKILAKQMMNDWPEYGITDNMVEIITSASSLHDVGKIMIPDSILLKPGKLTAEEFEIMKKHSEYGYEVVKKALKNMSESYYSICFDICRYHHEKYDGKGYPLGLRGDEIPIAAQIVSIADCFDALITKRVYKDAYPIDTAFNMIIDGECGQFSDKMISSFISSKKQLYRHALDSSIIESSSLSGGVSTSSLAWTKLLLVDDSELSREIGMEILEAEGAEIVAASSALEAIEIFSSSKINEYSAIIMDIIMPEIDGIEATRRIRKLDHPEAKSIPIIALTSLMTNNDLTACLDAGMNSFLTKPISISSLNSVLYSCLNSASESLEFAITSIEQEATQRIRQVVLNNISFSGSVDDYDLLFYVSSASNDILAYLGNDCMMNLISKTSSSLPNNRRIDQLLKSIIPNSSFQSFLEDCDRFKIINYLNSHPSYHIIFPAVINDEKIQYRLKVVQDSNNPDCYLVALQNMEEEVREDFRARQIIQQLTLSYLSLYYIDFHNDTFIRYHSSSKLVNAFGYSGTFSEMINAYANKIVYEPYRESFLNFVNIDSIKEKFSYNKTISFRYKDNINGVQHFREIQFTSESSESEYAIMTVSDIDEMVRKDIENTQKLKETQKDLVDAKTRANYDILTGAKTTTAFADEITSITSEIQNNPDYKFAVIECDINNLKSANDIYGHYSGDIYIKNCSAILCSIFSSDNVYRIGGDEFAVVIKDSMFVRRNELIAELKRQLKVAKSNSSIESGLASFAFGIAEYNKNIDSCFSNVLSRADDAMYENKRKLGDQHQLFQ